MARPGMSLDIRTAKSTRSHGRYSAIDNLPCSETNSVSLGDIFISHGKTNGTRQYQFRNCRELRYGGHLLTSFTTALPRQHTISSPICRTAPRVVAAVFEDESSDCGCRSEKCSGHKRHSSRVTVPNAPGIELDLNMTGLRGKCGWHDDAYTVFHEPIDLSMIKFSEQYDTGIPSCDRTWKFSSGSFDNSVLTIGDAPESPPNAKAAKCVQ